MAALGSAGEAAPGVPWLSAESPPPRRRARPDPHVTARGDRRRTASCTPFPPLKKGEGKGEQNKRKGTSEKEKKNPERNKAVATEQNKTQNNQLSPKIKSKPTTTKQKYPDQPEISS